LTNEGACILRTLRVVVIHPPRSTGILSTLVLRSRTTSLRVTVGEIATMVIDAHEAMEKLGLGKAP
jgi:hypothetical protein